MPTEYLPWQDNSLASHIQSSTLSVICIHQLVMIKELVCEFIPHPKKIMSSSWTDICGCAEYLEVTKLLGLRIKCIVIV